MDRVKYMSKAETKQLRQSAEARAYLDDSKGRVGGALAWMLVDTALSTGLRVSELASLKVKDINFKRGCLTVTRLKKKKKKKCPETLAISKELTKHLQSYIESGTNRANGMLFVGKRGTLSAQGLQQIWKASIKRAGLPKELSIHSARHTIAVHLLKKTKNLRQVQKQLGHSSPATTANMYADVSFEDMAAGLDGLYEDNE